jgi:GTPase SAR1 family protein
MVSLRSGLNVKTVDYKSIRLIIWDIGDQNKTRSLQRLYFQNTQAIIYVVDSNDCDRINDVRD